MKKAMSMLFWVVFGMFLGFVMNQALAGIFFIDDRVYTLVEIGLDVVVYESEVA